jgi:predicted Ser/Thr protein kinase
MDDSRVVAQGGLGILYKGEWRGCEVAIKKPLDPRAAMDASLKEDFEREVGADALFQTLMCWV